MGSGIVVILFWVIIAIVIGVLAITSQIAEKKRAEDVKGLAQGLGLEYLDSLSAEDRTTFERFELANRGRNRVESNVIIADSGELRMVIFDYRYTTGSGKSKSTTYHTVVLCQSDGLQLPQFSLSPESFMHRLGDFFGFKDIDFDDDKVFSDKFLLKGADEEAIRAFFDVQRRQACLEFDNDCLEGLGRSFVFFRKAERLDSSKVKMLMERAFQVFNLLSNSG